MLPFIPRNAKVSLFLSCLVLNQLLVNVLLVLIPGYAASPYVLRVILLYAFCYALPLWLFFKVSRWPAAETLPIRPLSFSNVLLILGLAVAVQPIMSFLSAIGALFSTNQVVTTLDQMTAVPFWQTLIGLALFPAVCEELVFRGVVLSGFRNTPARTAILMTGLLFGLMHLNIQQFFYATALGMLFAVLALRSGSLLASMLCHFTVNGIQLGLYYWSLSHGAATQATPSTLSEMWSVVGTTALPALVSAPVIWLLVRLFLRKNPREKVPANCICDERILNYAPLPGTAEPVIHFPFWILLGGFLVFSFLLS